MNPQIDEILKEMAANVEQAGDEAMAAVIASAAEALVLAILLTGGFVVSSAERLSAGLAATNFHLAVIAEGMAMLNVRLDDLTGEVQNGRKVLRVYDWAKNK